MKKILITLLLTLFSFALIAQERELSDYEKYRMEKEKELYAETQEQEVFYIVEDMPKFKGEDGKEFRKYIAENVRYPKEAIQNGTTGKVIVSFIVDKNGDVTNAKVEKSVDPYLDAEAIRVVESSPKWIAGKQRGKAVNVKFTFPINFVLDTPQEEVTEPLVINNYYNGYNQPNYRFLLTFGYHYPSYYDPFYYDWYYGYDPYYYGGYYGYNYWYPYRSHYYPYWGYSHYYGHHHYYNYGYYSKPLGRRYASSSALGRNRNYYQPYNKTYRSGYVTPSTASKKNAVVNRPVTTTRTATQNTRKYTPTYNNPRMTTRPEYNRSTTRARTTSTQPRTQKSTTVRTQSRTTRSTSTYTRPSSSSRSSATYSRPSTTTRSRSYTAPSRAPSKSYSAPSRTPTRSSSSYSRSSSSGSRSYSSGSATRSSGSATRSSGASRSSAGRR